MFITFVAAFLLQGPPLPLPKTVLPELNLLSYCVRADKAIGITLLSLPKGTPLGTLNPELKALISISIQEVALDLEIMDPRERRYIMVPQKDEDMQTDLDMLRVRQIDFKDAPPLSDTERLPERAYANQLCSFNRSFRTVITNRMEFELDRIPLFSEVLAETDTCYRAWDLIRDAKCEFFYNTVRRQAMKRLKQEMGATAYEQGNWPDFVPRWRFNDLK